MYHYHQFKNNLHAVSSTKCTNSGLRLFIIELNYYNNSNFTVLIITFSNHLEGIVMHSLKLLN